MSKQSNHLQFNPFLEGLFLLCLATQITSIYQWSYFIILVLFYGLSWLVYKSNRDERCLMLFINGAGFVAGIYIIGLNIGIGILEPSFVLKSYPLLELVIVAGLMMIKGKQLAYRFSGIWLGSILVLLSLVIFETLPLAAEIEHIEILVGITGGVLGLIICLMTLADLLKLWTRQKTITGVLLFIRNQWQQYQLTFVRLSMFKDGGMSLIKFVLGYWSASVFMFANGITHVLFGFARHQVQKMVDKTIAQQLKTYLTIGKLLMWLSVAYIIYTVRYFLSPNTTQYPMNLALLIALYTFVEFSLDLRELYLLRHQNDLLAEALRFIRLASTLLCFVLTQTAIMSFAHKGVSGGANALSGLFFGSLVFLVGFIMWRRGKRYLKTLIEFEN